MTFNFNTPQKSKIPAQIRQEIALKSIRKEQPIKSLANEFGCSRTTVYEQQKIALQAVGQAFTPIDDDKVLFYLPITKKIIYTLVIMLHLTCRSTYRHIIEFLQRGLHPNREVAPASNKRLVTPSTRALNQRHRSLGLHSITCLQ